jgi:hypothetical protein
MKSMTSIPMQSMREFLTFVATTAPTKLLSFATFNRPAPKPAHRLYATAYLNMDLPSHLEPCSQQLHDVCTGTAGSIKDCVVPEYVFYYRNVYCPFAACRVSGESYEKCQCDSYINFCGIYQNKAGYETDPNTLKYCSISTCCQLARDDTSRNECLTESFQAVGFNSTVVANATSDQPGTTDATISTGGESESTTSPEGESESDATSTESLEPIDLTGGEAEAEAGDKDIPAAINACDVKRSSVLSVVGVHLFGS